MREDTAVSVEWKSLIDRGWMERYKHPYYAVYTNMPGDIIYEDEYQIVVRIDENAIIEDLQSSWDIKLQ